MICERKKPLLVHVRRSNATDHFIMARHLRVLFILLVFVVLGSGSPQSNYAIQGIDQEYAEGLPPKATLDGKVTELDTLQPTIKLNRTQAVLNCAAGSMHVELQFKEPFYGIAYSDFDRNSACYAKGNGLPTVTLELPLKGCGTRQDPQRVFTNNVVVRFHHGLEMEGDEVITIVCRYPPPLVPAPPDFLYIPPAPPPLVPKPLKEFEVLLIICAVLFLGLMLLGLGCSYYCLKQRNIQVIRKRPFSPVEDESERLSTIESFPGHKIPRVHAPSTESSSEVPLEETLASDYPSSIEDQPLRPDTVSSEYSDTHPQVDTEVIPAAVKKPQFAVNLRVAKQPEVRPRYSEEEGSITSVETGVAMSSHVPDLHPPPRRRPPPPVFSRVHGVHEPRRSIQHTELVDNLTVVDKEDIDRETKYTPQPLALAKKPDVTVHTVDDVYLQTIVEKRLIEDEERRVREVTQFYKKDQPKWDVVIRSHQAPPPDDDTWDRGSETTDVASSIGWSAVEEPPIRPHYSVLDRETVTRRTDVTRDDFDRTTVTRAMQKLQEDDTRVWNERWRVLLRVLESPPPPRDTPSEVGPPESDYDTDTASVLTEDDREKWRQIITTESTLRTLLTQATVREDYERIRRDTRYEKLFEPEKWDVIIRVLAPPDQPDRDDQTPFYSDSQSEVSSVAYPPSKPRRNYRKISSGTTNTEQKSITDVRSMTEVMVDFAVDDPLGRDDDSSIISSIPGATRSVADRSSTEIVEFAPLDEEDDFDLPGGGATRNNYRTEERQVSHRVDDDGNVVQESSTRKVFSSSSSRLLRY